MATSEEKVLIIGANGQLGRELARIFPKATAVDVAELDITNVKSLEEFSWDKFELVINAAAYTAVDQAETEQGRIDAWRINASAVGSLSAIASQKNLTLIHVSSDYVFDGSMETHLEDEPFSPLGVYGQSKAAGDIATAITGKHYLIRTSWVIGEGNNFVRTMKSLAEKSVTPSVVSDQFGRLTFTKDLAAGISHLITTRALFGTYNLSNAGKKSSWAEVAKIVFELVGKSADDVTPITTEQYYQGKVGIAPRPKNSYLNLDKIEKAGFAPRDWRIALEEYLKEIK